MHGITTTIKAFFLEISTPTAGFSSYEYYMCATQRTATILYLAYEQTLSKR